jgi:hypothetical protein
VYLLYCSYLSIQNLNKKVITTKKPILTIAVDNSSSVAELAYNTKEVGLKFLYTA